MSFNKQFHINLRHIGLGATSAADKLTARYSTCVLKYFIISIHFTCRDDYPQCTCGIIYIISRVYLNCLFLFMLLVFRLNHIKERKPEKTLHLMALFTPIKLIKNDAFQTKKPGFYSAIANV